MQYSGITLTPGFIISAATDPQFNYVTALLHGDGTNTGQNNTFLDSSPNNFTVTRSGTPTQGTFTPFGTLWSNFLNTGDKLTASASSAFDLSGSTWTIEFWMYSLATPTAGNECRMIMAGANGDAAGWSISNFNNGSIGFFRPYGGGPVGIATPASTIVLNNWYHVAVVCNAGSARIYINGTQAAGPVTISLPTSASQALRIGYDDVGTVNFQYNGYLSNLRIVKGTAVYTAAFTPPTAPLTAITNTSFLTCQSNRFRDNSTNNLTITPTGTPSVQVFSPFGTTTQYDPATIGGSGYFNGSTDYLTAPTGTAFQFAGDFTMEAWVYSLSATGQANYSCIFDTRATNTSSTTGIVVNFTPSGYLNFYINGTNYTSATLLGANNWTHVALVRSGSTISMYQNGVSVASVSYATSLSSGYFWAGALAGPAASGYWQGYISNLRVVNGTAVYTTTFTPPTIPLPSIGNTSLLLSGTNGQIYDNAMMSNFVTVGSAQISTSIYKYGTGSISFNGSTSYLTSNANLTNNFSTGNFTIECWVYFVSVANGQLVSAGSGTNTNAYYWQYYSGQLQFGVQNIGQITGTSWTPSASTWYHIAVVRSGTNVYQFVNGTQLGTTATSSQNFVDGPTYVGYGGAGYLNGYIDELRITKGFARYTSNFLSPPSIFPSTGNIPVSTPTVEYLVVAGGGGGGSAAASSGLGGGGGAGGFRTNVTGATSGGGGSAESTYTVTGGTAITVTVGAGGTAVTGNNRGNTGNNSVFGTITSAGGGGGSAGDAAIAASTGGSGGGGGNGGGAVVRTGAAGTANQGYSGGTSVNSGQNYPAAGGGGAGAVGSANPTNLQGGAGGAGVSSSITGSAVTYGGGGGGGINTVNGGASPGAGGAGGGGAGGINTFGTAGTVNTGGGGGGSGGDSATGGGAGGSGIVIVRYPTTFSLASSTTGNPTVTTTGGYNTYTWTSSGSITF